MYRLLDNLGGELQKGTLQTLSHLSPKAIKALLAKDRIAEWQSPPLEVLPGWQRKAEVFAEVGITTVAQLVMADPEELLKRLEIPAMALESCLEEVIQWVQ